MNEFENRSVAVIGSGYWGKNLVRNFQELGNLHTICDSNELIAETYRSKYPSVQFTASFADVLADEDIEAVAVATPAVTHFSIAMAALKSGKHVFVEKPLALNEEEGKQLVEFAEKQNRTLMVGHILQYHKQGHTRGRDRPSESWYRCREANRDGSSTYSHSGLQYARSTGSIQSTNKPQPSPPRRHRYHRQAE